MAKTGDIIDYFDDSGQKIIFHQTASDNDGELLRVEAWLKPGTFQPGYHIHPYQEERIEVISGVMGWRYNGTISELHPGDSATAAPGEPHDFWVIGDEPAHFIFEFRPALNFEVFLEIGIGRLKGRKHLLQYSVMLQEMDRVFQPASTFKGVLLGLLMALVAPIARMMGYKVQYDE